MWVAVAVVVLFALTGRASTIPCNIRRCRSGTWSAGQEKIKGIPTKLQREHEKQKQTKTKDQTKNTNHILQTEERRALDKESLE